MTRLYITLNPRPCYPYVFHRCCLPTLADVCLQDDFMLQAMQQAWDPTLLSVYMNIV